MCMCVRVCMCRATHKWLYSFHTPNSSNVKSFWEQVETGISKLWSIFYIWSSLHSSHIPKPWDSEMFKNLFKQTHLVRGCAETEIWVFPSVMWMGLSIDSSASQVSPGLDIPWPWLLLSLPIHRSLLLLAIMVWMYNAPCGLRYLNTWSSVGEALLKEEVTSVPFYRDPLKIIVFFSVFGYTKWTK